MIFLIIYLRVKLDVIYHIDNVCVTHVMYVDDIYLMALSSAALQNHINICYDFSRQNNLSTLPSHFVKCLNQDCLKYHVLRFI